MFFSIHGSHLSNLLGGEGEKIAQASSNPTSPGNGEQLLPLDNEVQEAETSTFPNMLGVLRAIFPW